MFNLLDRFWSGVAFGLGVAVGRLLFVFLKLAVVLAILIVLLRLFGVSVIPGNVEGVIPMLKALIENVQNWMMMAFKELSLSR